MPVLSPLTGRRSLTLGAVILALVAAMWWCLWMLAAAEYRTAIDRWITAGRAAGYDIAYDSREMFGFPHHVVMRFGNIHWKNTEGISFQADGMDLASTPWRWQTFDARFKGHVEVDAPLDKDGRSLTLEGEGGRAHVDLDADGVWRFARVFLSQAKTGRAPDALCLADRLEASVQRPGHPPKDHTQPGLILGGAAENVTLPAVIVTPFGPKMAALKADMRVMGEMPDFRRKDSVAAWNVANGVMEFDNLVMNWGPLKLQGKGTLGFDDDLQPEGAFSSAIGNHKEVLKALMDANFIPKRQAVMLNSALSLFAKPAGGMTGIEVPVTIQLGGLFLGPVRIFEFSPIEWPKEGVAPAPSNVQAK